MHHLAPFETTAHVQQKILHLCVESRPLAGLDEIRMWQIQSWLMRHLKPSETKITTRSKVSGTVFIDVLK